jgi:hypothetical protein
MTGRIAMIGAALAVLITVMPSLANEFNLQREKVELVVPPLVHPQEQATKQPPKIVEFRMVIEEKEIVIDDQGTKFQAMTFNGSIPGPMMVVHEGDYLELTLVNPATNTMLVAVVVHREVPLGHWTVAAWDPQRYLAPYATKFIEKMAIHCRRSYPGRDYIRGAPTLPKPKVE